MEIHPAVGEGPQRVFGGRRRSRDRTWPKPGTSMQESRVGESRELFPEFRSVSQALAERADFGTGWRGRLNLNKKPGPC